MAQASKFDFQHGEMESRDYQIDAMDRVKEIVGRQHFSGTVKAVTQWVYVRMTCTRPLTVLSCFIQDVVLHIYVS